MHRMSCPRHNIQLHMQVQLNLHPIFVITKRNKHTAIMKFKKEIIICSIANLSLLKEALKQLPNVEPDIWTI